MPHQPDRECSTASTASSQHAPQQHNVSMSRLISHLYHGPRRAVYSPSPVRTDWNHITTFPSHAPADSDSSGNSKDQITPSHSMRVSSHKNTIRIITSSGDHFKHFGGLSDYSPCPLRGPGI